MSEYQYYEFTAVDRPLSPKQQAELRTRSSRATITATSFVNVYNWGDLKGDPMDWMQRYFDAHVHSANWGSCRLLLRLPLAALDETALQIYVSKADRPSQLGFVGALEATRTDEHWILEWSFNDDSGEHQRFWSQEDGPGWMVRLLPLRDELLHGDTRPLYLGWLARLGNGELEDDDLEPHLPAGLQSLTPAQEALAEFLPIDPDWLAAAAEASAPLATADDDVGRDEWLASLAPETMRDALRLLLGGQGRKAERDLRLRFLAWQKERCPSATGASQRRTVAQMDARRQLAREMRLKRERQAAEAARAQRLRERAEYLRRRLERAGSAWSAIDTTLQRRSGAAYDQALHGVADLAEAYGQAGRQADFAAELARLMARNGKRKAWVDRLIKARLWREPAA